MKLNNHSTTSMIFLSIINLCICVQDISVPSNSYNEIENSRFPNRNKESVTINSKYSHKLSDDNVDSLSQHVTIPQQMSEYQQSFLIVDYLAAGEVERRLNFNGITAKETSIVNNGYVVMFFLFRINFCFFLFKKNVIYVVHDCCCRYKKCCKHAWNKL